MGREPGAAEDAGKACLSDGQSVCTFGPEPHTAPVLRVAGRAAARTARAWEARGMRRVLVLLTAVLLASCLLGAATTAWAIFRNPETSGDAQFAAGTLDLKTNNADGVSQTLRATSLQPGNTVGPATIQLKNAGTLNASSLRIAFTYVESDSSPNSMNMTSDQTAAVLEVTVLSYNSSSLLSSVADSNSNGYIDIQDLKNASLTGLSGINASATKSFQVAVQVRSDTSSNYDADGIDLTMTFILSQ